MICFNLGYKKQLKCRLPAEIEILEVNLPDELKMKLLKAREIASKELRIK